MFDSEDKILISGEVFKLLETEFEMETVCDMGLKLETSNSG